MIDKKILRKELLNLRDSYPNKEQNSQMISQILQESLKEYKKIALYYPFKGEVNIWPLILELINVKEIYLPVSKNKLLFKRLDSPNSLKAGQLNILEPTGDELKDINELEAIVIPSIAINNSGYRLGFGKGLYDRAMAEYKGLKIGVIYEFQLISTPFEEEHDMKFDIIITEKGKKIVGLKDV